MFVVLLAIRMSYFLVHQNVCIAFLVNEIAEVVASVYICHCIEMVDKMILDSCLDVTFTFGHDLSVHIINRLQEFLAAVCTVLKN